LTSQQFAAFTNGGIMSKYNMRQYLMLILILASTIENANSQATSNCAVVYTNNLANTSVGARSSVFKQQTFDKYCEINGSSRSSNSGIDLTVPIEGIILGFHGTQSDAQQQMQNFCKQYSSDSFKTDNQYSYDRQVVIGALQSFNECIAMEQNGIRMSNAISNPTSIVIAADFGSDRTVTVRNAVYDVTAGQCYFAGTPVGKKKDVIIPGLISARVFKKPFSIACDRNSAALVNGVKKYPSFRIVLDTSAGRYSVEIPADDVQDWESASIAKARYALLEAARDAVVVERDTLDQRIKNFSLEIRSVTQNNEGISITNSGEMVGCPPGNSAEGYAAGVCGPNKITRMKPIQGNEGGFCGRTAIAYTCSSF
jgi:hypothetical protein